MIKYVTRTYKIYISKHHKYFKIIDNASFKAKNLYNDALYIERIEVWRGPKIKRVRFVSRSRISHYEKYRAYVKVVLNTK